MSCDHTNDNYIMESCYIPIFCVWLTIVYTGTIFHNPNICKLYDFHLFGVNLEKKKLVISQFLFVFQCKIFNKIQNKYNFTRLEMYLLNRLNPKNANELIF